MDSTADAVGTVIEGALAARAVEPDAGEGGHSCESTCLNCGTALVGRHCHQCGQAAHVHRTLGALFHDLLHGLLHFEGKIWRTIPMLAWRPGKLTREYIDGRRASYVSPIALFLFCVFLTFAVVHLSSGPFHIYGTPKGSNVTVRDGSPEGKAKAEAKIDNAIARLKQQRAAAVAARKGGEVTDAIDTQIENLEDAREGVVQARPANEMVVSGGDKADFSGSSVFGIDIADRLNEAWHKAKANPELTALKMEENAHKYSWLLIPFSVPFVWIMFPFSRRFRVYDHTVFVTYSLCFMMLLQCAMVLAGAAGAGWIAALLALFVPVHMYRQLRGAYGVSRFGGLVRTVWLLFSALFALLFWVLSLMALLLAE